MRYTSISLETTPFIPIYIYTLALLISPRQDAAVCLDKLIVIGSGILAKSNTKIYKFPNKTTKKISLIKKNKLRLTIFQAELNTIHISTYITTYQQRQPSLPERYQRPLVRFPR